MPKTSEMIESKYLRKEDVQGDVLVTIAKIGRVNVALDDQPPEMKWAVRFTEFKKPMVLNTTNIQLIEKALGSDDTDKWAGCQVVLYVDENVSFQGKLIGGLRVKKFIPAPLPPAAPPPQPVTTGAGGAGRFADMDDDIPF